MVFVYINYRHSFFFKIFRMDKRIQRHSCFLSGKTMKTTVLKQLTLILCGLIAFSIPAYSNQCKQKTSCCCEINMAKNGSCCKGNAGSEKKEENNGCCSVKEDQHSGLTQAPVLLKVFSSPVMFPISDRLFSSFRSSFKNPLLSMHSPPSLHFSGNTIPLLI